jgi:tripartite-type tricarboxylate transporter receptor subunit TctC
MGRLRSFAMSSLVVRVLLVALVALALPAVATSPAGRAPVPAERPVAGGEPPLPERPLTIVVPYAAGGPTDTVARKLAFELARVLDQAVEVRNLPGNGGTRAPAQMAAGAGDGQELLLHHIGMATAPSLFRQLGYDPVRDFEPVGLVADAPMVLLTSPRLPVSGGRELVAYLRAHQASLAVAYAGVGAASHLCGLMLGALLKVDLISVPYPGTGPALAHLEQGGADLLCDQTTATLKSIREGRVRAHAVTLPQRLEVLPELPTTTEQGLPGLQLSIWHGLYAPAGTPQAAVARLSRALQRAVASPGFLIAMSQAGVLAVPPEQATPAALRARLVAQIAAWRPLIQRSGQFAD